MKFQFQQAALLRELQLLSSVVDRKVTIPILAGVKLSVTANGDISCVSTNLDNALQSHCAAEAVARPGAIVVPLDTLSGLLLRFPAGICTLEAKDDSATLSADRARSSVRVPVWPLDDYPVVAVPGATVATVAASVLLGMVGRVRHAMGESSYFPAGAHFSIADGHMRLAATDSHRIAYATHEADNETTIRFSVADRAWDALGKLLRESSADEPVAIALGENMAWWTAGQRTLASRLFDRKFPEYERVMPKKFAFTVTVDAKQLRDVLRRHIVLATAETCRVVFQFGDGTLQMSSTTYRGAAEDVVAIEDAPSKQAPFVLNPKYAVDALDALDADRVDLSLSNERSVTRWCPTDAPDLMTASISTMRL